MTDSPQIRRITEALIDGDAGQAVEAAREALEAGLDPMLILNDGLIAGAGEVGKLFEQGVFFLPELLLTGKALKAAMEVVRPRLVEKYSGSAEMSGAKIVIATVHTDIHDIGKNLVSSMLTAAGYEVIDLGVDVPIKTIIDKAEEYGAALIALSALLTTSKPYMQDVIAMLKARGLREKYRVMVGGAPVTPEWAAEIGADGTAPNAAEAVTLAHHLIKAQQAEGSVQQGSVQPGSVQL
jgi:corrinoid protein of di/trimethylamine methyltransferase